MSPFVFALIDDSANAGGESRGFNTVKNNLSNGKLPSSRFIASLVINI